MPNVTCPHCEALLTTSEAVGENVQCSKCGRTFDIVSEEETLTEMDRERPGRSLAMSGVVAGIIVGMMIAAGAAAFLIAFRPEKPKSVPAIALNENGPEQKTKTSVSNLPDLFLPLPQPEPEPKPEEKKTPEELAAAPSSLNDLAREQYLDGDQLLAERTLWKAIGLCGESNVEQVLKAKMYLQIGRLTSKPSCFKEFHEILINQGITESAIFRMQIALRNDWYKLRLERDYRRHEEREKARNK
jgi:DNA-directed RNA polymerase subunit M/transcription elongation factor TFIIS